ncbi:pilus assembly protein [Streptomyces sp. NBC_01142]|uniref:TadE/TadG family type IV pilus assembly protein n=1 Tax=Streptomyces sp. NBC_01142 TaxID=2975865 RepID=UPI0022599C36|nr:TadE/TadG family type IV pilus assembly protein [Streptomyces sp. NBC_01142]MCX4819072.1 pilus assembly protein [Streptomyces sp. NBC_01142]
MRNKGMRRDIGNRALRRDMRKQTLRRDRRNRALRRDKGQAVIEYGGWLVLLLFVAMVAVQVGVAVYAAQQAGTAARAAARVASQREAQMTSGEAGRAAVSSWLDAEFSPPKVAGDEVTVDATVQIPVLVPGLDFGGVKKSATMPLD